jgi:DNA-binding NarL/FixJ family response regulator
MSDVRVPVKTWLRAPTYQKLDRVAKQRGLADVGSLLEQMVEQAVTPKPRDPSKRAWNRMTPARVERLQELRRLGWKQSAIAKDLGVSDATVSIYVRFGGWQS